MTKRVFNLYCDGASRKDGRGGWGYALFEGVVLLRTACGGDLTTTNNRMELTAAIRGLRSLPEGHVVTVYCDSQYVVNGITDHIDLWLRTNWKTSGNKDVKNRDLWEELADLDLRYRPVWLWVRGHDGNYGNELADQMAAKGVSAL